MTVARRLNKSDAPKNITQDEKIMNENDFIVSKTDTKGFITYGNKIFVDMSGYSKDEIIGANHNLIRHPDMPKAAFWLAWHLIQEKKEFFGFVKNLRKCGGYYWVYAYITADLDDKGNIRGYTSFRRKPSRSAIETLTPIYKLLKDAEIKDGVEASKQTLFDYLAQNNISYEELVVNLQAGV